MLDENQGCEILTLSPHAFEIMRWNREQSFTRMRHSPDEGFQFLDNTNALRYCAAKHWWNG